MCLFEFCSINVQEDSEVFELEIFDRVFVLFEFCEAKDGAVEFVACVGLVLAFWCCMAHHVVDRQDDRVVIQDRPTTTV